MDRIFITDESGNYIDVNPAANFVIVNTNLIEINSIDLYGMSGRKQHIE